MDSSHHPTGDSENHPAKQRRCGRRSRLLRFPLRPIVLRQPESRYCRFGAAVATSMDRKFLLVSVHFESIGLNNDDKALFHELTEGEATSRSDSAVYGASSFLNSRRHSATVPYRHNCSVANRLAQHRKRHNRRRFQRHPGCYAPAAALPRRLPHRLLKAGRVTRHTYTPTGSISTSTISSTVETYGLYHTPASHHHIRTTTPSSPTSS